MALGWFIKNSIKKNIEKWIFFSLFALTCVVILLLVINLPYFKTSLYAKKITRTSTAAAMKKVDVTPYNELISVLKKPLDYAKLFTRDTFSPHIERKTCDSCGKTVAKNLDICPFCSHAFDSDADSMPNQWEKRYGLNAYDPEDSYLDKDGDGFSNLAEFRAETNPNDPNSKPEEYNPLGQYRLVKIFKKPLKLLFEGYMQLPGGEYSFVINSGASSTFVKVGDKIDGYTIVEFNKNLISDVRRGVEVKHDASELMLINEAGEKITLKYHQVAAEKELWAQIEDTDNRTVFDIQAGDAIGPFLVNTISDSEIMIVDEKENKFTLKYERRRNEK